MFLKQPNITVLLTVYAVSDSTNTTLYYKELQHNTKSIYTHIGTMSRVGGVSAVEGKKIPEGVSIEKTRRTLASQSPCLPLLPQRSHFTTVSNTVGSRQTNRRVWLI